jgi:hypothetical protein
MSTVILVFIIAIATTGVLLMRFHRSKRSTNTPVQREVKSKDCTKKTSPGFSGEATPDFANYPLY